MKKFALILSIFVVTVITLFALLNTKVFFSPRASENKPIQEIRIGPEEQIFTTTQEHIPDFPYLTIQTQKGLIGVLSIGGPGAQRAYKTLDPLASKLNSLAPLKGFVKGTARTDPDWGGVWLSATFSEPFSKVIHGIYHAETHFGSDPPSLKNDIWTAAYIRSNDGGETWIKPNYPNNVLLTAVGNPQTDGVDANSLIKVGSDVYLYYFENTLNEYRGTGVAKAPISEIGNPGSWKKYYCQSNGSCGFTEPGIGGRSTIIRSLEGKTPVAYNTYLNKFIAVSGIPLLNNNNFNLYESSNGIDFKKYGKSINIESSIGPGWVIVYGNLISLEGITGETGQTFYYYYVVIKRNPTTQEITDPKRYLMRRKVTLLDSSIKLTPKNLSLFRLYSPTLKAHIYTSSLDEITQFQNIGSKNEGTCCKIAENQAQTSVPLYRVNTPNDYFMETKDSQIEIAQKAGYRNKKLLGYCFPEQNHPLESIPLYRLYNPIDTDHFYTTKSDEVKQLIATKKWRTEGVTCYVLNN